MGLVAEIVGVCTDGAGARGHCGRYWLWYAQVKGGLVIDTTELASERPASRFFF